MNKFSIMGEIVADDSQRWFESDVVPGIFNNWLNKQEGDVEIDINSPGGDVSAGLAIANAIKSYSKGKVTANVLGCAASMASVIACAADELKMGKGAFLMVHNPLGILAGEAEDLRHHADVLDQMKKSIIGFYQTKSKKTPEELSALMDAETWIAAEDMEANGFACTFIESDFKAAACATRRAFGKAPDAAKAFFRSFDKRPEEAETFAKRLAGMQAAKDKEIAEMKAEGEKAVADLKAQLDEAAKARASLEAEIKTLTTDRDSARASLEETKASLEQSREEVAKSEKALSETKAALEDQIKLYRAQVGGAMEQPVDGEVSAKDDWTRAYRAMKSAK